MGEGPWVYRDAEEGARLPKNLVEQMLAGILPLGDAIDAAYEIHLIHLRDGFQDQDGMTRRGLT
ncbi:MAG: hypothetical protein WC068_12825 [Caulobacter sp.]